VSRTDDSATTDSRDPNDPAGPEDARQALSVYGRLVVGPGDGTCSPYAHLHEGFARLRHGTRSIEHEAQLPLRVEAICTFCRKYGTDADGRLNPVGEDGTFVYRSEAGTTPPRTCGCLGCRDDAFVVIDHPDHGRRAVCPRHQRDHDVVEEVDNA